MTQPTENPNSREFALTPRNPEFVRAVAVGWHPDRATFYARVFLHTAPDAPAVDVPFLGQTIDYPNVALGAIQRYAHVDPGMDAALLRLALPDLQNAFTAAFEHVQQTVRGAVSRDTERTGSQVAARILAAEKKEIQLQAKRLSGSSSNKDLRGVFRLYWENISMATNVIESTLQTMTHTRGPQAALINGEFDTLMHDLRTSTTEPFRA